MQKGVVNFIACVALILLNLTADTIAAGQREFNNAFEKTNQGTSTTNSDIEAAIEQEKESKTDKQLTEELKECQRSVAEKNKNSNKVKTTQWGQKECAQNCGKSRINRCKKDCLVNCLDSVCVSKMIREDPYIVANKLKEEIAKCQMTLEHSKNQK